MQQSTFLLSQRHGSARQRAPMLVAALVLCIACLAVPTKGAGCLTTTTSTITLLGPAANASMCDQTAASLNLNTRLRSNHVAYLRAWSCASCTPLSNTSAVCLANISATMKPLALVQLYENAWAVPTGGVYVTRNLLRYIVQTNPTCNNGATCQDLLPQALHDMLGGGEPGLAAKTSWSCALRRLHAPVPASLLTLRPCYSASHPSLRSP